MEDAAASLEVRRLNPAVGFGGTEAGLVMLEKL